MGWSNGGTDRRDKGAHRNMWQWARWHNGYPHRDDIHPIHMIGRDQLELPRADIRPCIPVSRLTWSCCFSGIQTIRRWVDSANRCHIIAHKSCTIDMWYLLFFSSWISQSLSLGVVPVKCQFQRVRCWLLLMERRRAMGALSGLILCWSLQTEKKQDSPKSYLIEVYWWNLHR